MRTRPVLAASSLTLLLVLAGCSADMASSDESVSGRDDSGFDTDAPAVDGEQDMAEESAGDGATGGATSGGTGGGTGGEVVTFGGSTSAGRQLARTASVTLEVADVEQSAQRVAAAADRAGGFVSGAEVRGGDFGYGRITLRVPATRLDQVVEDLGEVGVRVVESSISTEDLTEQLTDLGARITNLQLLETELQALLAEVRDGDPNAQQLLSVFERITQVRGDIERLEAQRASASDRVALATVNIELVPTATAPEEVEPVATTTVGRAWQATQDAFAAIGAALTWFGITILPVALVVVGIPLLLLWAAVRAVSRRRDERRASALAAAPPAPAGPPSQPAPTTQPVGASSAPGPSSAPSGPSDASTDAES